METKTLWLTRASACARCGIKPHHIEYLARRGTIRRARIGGGPLRPRWGYHRADVDRIADQLEQFGTLTCDRGAR